MDVNPYPYRHPNLRVVRGDAMRAPFAARSFAAVLAISVIEHIGIGHYGDPAGVSGDRAAVQEIARVLRRDGRALITVPFGHARTDDLQRVYDPARIAALLEPLVVRRIEYAWSREGLWCPCSEAEAATVDWAGPSRAVALVVGTTP
jgi:SAM-dependent methyltransferase